MSKQARRVKHEALPRQAEGLYYNKGIFDEALVYYDEEVLYVEVRGKDSGIAVQCRHAPARRAVVTRLGRVVRTPLTRFASAPS
jgi:hypothetical protein